MEAKIDVVDVMRSIPWFQELTTAGFERLVRIAHLQEIQTGEELFREGDNDDNLYFILNGRIALDISLPPRGRVRIYTAEPLDLIGWSSVTPTVRQRTAAARAVLPSRLLVFDGEGVRQACEADHDLGYVVMRRLANVVASRLLVTRLQLLDMFSNPEPEASRA